MVVATKIHQVCSMCTKAAMPAKQLHVASSHAADQVQAE